MVCWISLVASDADAVTKHGPFRIVQDSRHVPAAQNVAGGRFDQLAAQIDLGSVAAGDRAHDDDWQAIEAFGQLLQGFAGSQAVDRELPFSEGRLHTALVNDAESAGVTAPLIRSPSSFSAQYLPSKPKSALSDSPCAVSLMNSSTATLFRFRVFMALLIKLLNPSSAPASGNASSALAVAGAKTTIERITAMANNVRLAGTTEKTGMG